MQGEEIAETLQLFVNSLTGGFSNSPKLVGSPVKYSPQIPHPPKPSQPLTIFEYNETKVNKLKPSNSLGKQNYVHSYKVNLKHVGYNFTMLCLFEETLMMMLC